MRRVIGALLVALGLAAAAFGLWPLVADRATEARYEGLASEVVTEGGVDWDALLGSVPGCVAWVEVGNTPISYPVMQATAADPTYWLHHDAWGDPSGEGCPFVDHRTTPDSSRVLVYGHHLGTTHKVFSDLYDCHDQARFDTLGELTWVTPARGATRLRPLCALVVDESDPLVQELGETGVASTRAWLAEILARSSARAGDADELAATSVRAVALVTCSSLTPGQDARTVVVFVA